jgi:DNA sulfur modification protein DndE
MLELQAKRLRFSGEADNWLKVLKTRTGLTPNIICRIGFCLSMAEGGIPSPVASTDDSTREINRFTLLGEYDQLFVALLRQRLMQDGISLELLDDQFKDHVHRGIMLLSSRVKSLSDIVGLIPLD